jgi:hypothetical protein
MAKIRNKTPENVRRREWRAAWNQFLKMTCADGLNGLWCGVGGGDLLDIVFGGDLSDKKRQLLLDGKLSNKQRKNLIEEMRERGTRRGITLEQIVELHKEFERLFKQDGDGDGAIPKKPKLKLI